MSIRSEKDLDGLMEIGRIVGTTLQKVADLAVEGVTTSDLNAITAKLLKADEAEASPKFEYGFPGDICISINDEAVHGIPRDRRIQPGDVVKLDLTARKGGYVADAAVTVNVEPAREKHRRLAMCARRAFDAAMAVTRANVRINELGRAIQNEVERDGFSVLYDLCGHGVGRKTHEPPEIPNFYHPAARQRLSPGLVIAVEPIISTGGTRVIPSSDGWTIRTADGSVAAHYEHTVIVTESQPILVTGQV